MATNSLKLSTMVEENFAFTHSQMATNSLKLSTIIGENFAFTHPQMAINSLKISIMVVRGFLWGECGRLILGNRVWVRKYVFFQKKIEKKNRKIFFSKRKDTSIP